MIDTKANRPQLSSCPARDELLDFVLGKLPWATLEVVGEHAEECPSCQAELETLEGVEDSVIRDIKTSSRTPQPFSPELEARIRRAEQIGPEVWSQQQRDQHPDHLGHYQIQQRIGQGGMGTVYRAFHTRLKRPVALKLLPSDKLKEPQAIARFHREMEAIGQLDHANLVRAYDAGEADGHHFLAMEFIEGTDLARLVRSKGPLSVADACEIIRQAAIGLHYAHEHGYVHRDIKPSNLMLNSQGQLKILDLGLASIVEEADEADRDRVLGTGDYVAPEQGQDATAADRRSDIYSLGCTLYYLLCGRAPFGDTEHDTFAKKVTAHAKEPVPPIKGSRDDVPAGLQAVLDRMLEKDADERYQTADEIAEALTSFAAGSDLGGGLGGDRSKTSPRLHTRNWLWCGAAVLFIGVVAAVMWPWVFPPTEPKLGGDPPRPQPRTITNSIGMELVEVAAGEFKMGATSDDRNAQGNELPRHRVVISKPFFIGKCEVTVGQFKAFVEAEGYQTEAERSGKGGWRVGGHGGPGGKIRSRFEQRPDITWRNPTFPQTDEHAVVLVTWADAVAFCKWLTKKEGVTYRLPTEAEWEFACRGGTTTIRHSPKPVELLAWCRPNSSIRTQPVGRRLPNPLGLFDMYGNVRELCSDWFADDYYAKSPTVDPLGPPTGTNRVIRGGGFADFSPFLRSSHRGKVQVGDAINNVGFRVVRESARSRPDSVSRGDRGFQTHRQ